MRRHVKSTILATGLVLILGSLIIQSCCKKPLPPPPPPVEEEKDPTLEVFFPEEEIPYGEKDIVLSWTTTNAKSLYVNGVKRSGESHTILDRLFKDTTFIFKAVNIKKEVGKEITLNIGDWTSSTFGLVSYYPWRYDSLGVSSLDGRVLRRWSVTPEQKAVVYFYLKEGIMYSSKSPSWVNPWYILDENTIVINGSVQKLQVDDKQMILSYQTENHGEIVWFDMIFEHASDVPNDPD